jgi:hypothetical protein
MLLSTGKIPATDAGKYLTVVRVRQAGGTAFANGKLK